MDSRKLQWSALCCSVLILVSLVCCAQCATVHQRRAVPENDNTPSVKICHKSTPCEWAVYQPFTRRIDYIMKNTCECGQGLVCTRTNDDISVGAYVHRCLAPAPAS